ncbi:hypothetical protein PTKIN_Ptkin09bG0251700 [Pterospermum kingtungense]
MLVDGSHLEREYVKVNFDGALRIQEKNIRNSEGEVMGASFGSISLVMDPLLVEAIASVKALEFARDMGFTRIVLEGDAASFLHTFRERNSVAHALALWGLGLLVDSIWAEDYPPFLHDALLRDVSSINS